MSSVHWEYCFALDSIYKIQCSYMYEVEEQWHAPVCLEYVLHKTACIKEKLLQCKAQFRAESNQADKNRRQFKKLHKTTSTGVHSQCTSLFYWSLCVQLHYKYSLLQVSTGSYCITIWKTIKTVFITNSKCPTGRKSPSHFIQMI